MSENNITIKSETMNFLEVRKRAIADFTKSTTNGDTNDFHTWKVAYHLGYDLAKTHINNLQEENASLKGIIADLNKVENNY